LLTICVKDTLTARRESEVDVVCGAQRYDRSADHIDKRWLLQAPTKD